MSIVQFNINDGDMIKEGLRIINVECKTNFTMNSIGHMEKFLTNIDIIQNGGSIDGLLVPPYHGTFFGNQGHPSAGYYGPEYAYILAFGLPCRDFIGRYKCIYHYNKNAFGMSWYSVLGKIAGASGINPDPYPDYVKYDEDKVNHDVCHDPRNKLASIVNSEETSSDKTAHSMFIYPAIASFLFIIFSNHMIYKATNMIGGTINESGCPTETGIILHAFVLFLVFLIMIKYL